MLSETPLPCRPSSGLTTQGTPMWSRASTAASSVRTTSPRGTGMETWRSRSFVNSLSPAVAVETAGDKEFTKLLLRQVSIPVPRGEVVRTEEAAVEALDHIGVPCVVKPLDGRQGKGVSLNISTPEQARQAFRVAREFSEKVLVEELFVGKNYRVLV